MGARVLRGELEGRGRKIDPVFAIPSTLPQLHLAKTIDQSVVGPVVEISPVLRCLLPPLTCKA